jgi:hypothetical protein
MSTKVRRLPSARLERRSAPVLPAEERWLVLFSISFAACALFVAGFAPIFLVATVVFACALGEAFLLVDWLLLLKNPIADVRELRPDR